MSEESETEHNVYNLDIPDLREFTEQQNTILQLRAENVHLTTVGSRLEALEKAIENGRTLVQGHTPYASGRPAGYSGSETAVGYCFGSDLSGPAPLVMRITPVRELLALPPPEPVSHCKQLEASKHNKHRTYTTITLPAPAHITSEFLLDSSPALQQPKSNNLFPHNFVTCGDSCRKINMGESTGAEHYAALRRLAADPACPHCPGGLTSTTMSKSSP